MALLSVHLLSVDLEHDVPNVSNIFADLSLLFFFKILTD